ncbi:MAG: NAD-glutamate dehydrogenase domain-containing protein [bacterium]
MKQAINKKEQFLQKLEDKDQSFRAFVSHFVDPLLRDFVVKNDEIISFLKQRYAYLKDKPLNHMQLRLSTNKQSSIGYTLEILHPNMPLVLMTIEETLMAFGVHVTRVYHPIIPVILDSNYHLKSVSETLEDHTLLAYCYVELQTAAKKESLDQLLIEIKEKLQAVTLVNAQEKEINEKVRLVQGLAKKHPTPLVEFHEEWVELFDWLLEKDNFSFFGFACFELNLNKKNQEIKLLKEDTLGILHSSSPFFESLTKALEIQIWHLREYRSPYIFDIIKKKSPVKRLENLMRLSLKIPQNGKTIEYNFVGLLKRSSLFFKNSETPIIRLKIDKIFKNKKILKDSYDYNQVIRFMTAVPKFELFRTATEHLIKMASDLLDISNPNEIFCFSRNKIVKERVFIMVAMSPKIHSRKNVEKIMQILIERVPHQSFEKIEVNGDQFKCLHVHFDQPQHKDWVPDCESIQKELRDALCTWEDRLKQIIKAKYPGQQSKLLIKQYADAFPRHHRVRRSPIETISDIESFEELAHSNEIQFNLVPFKYEDSVLKGKVSILYFYNKEKIDLIDIMPILENLEIHVYDQLTTRIGPKEAPYGYIHAFRIVDKQFKKLDELIYKDLLITFLKAYYRGHASNDPLNGLIVKEKLDWKEIAVLKAYREWYLQLGCPYGKEKINQSLLQYCKVSRCILAYFECKFSLNKAYGDTSYRQKKTLPILDHKFFDSLQQVDDIAADVIFKRLFMLIKATDRTNFYKERKEDQTYLSFKLNPQAAKHLPLPLPYKEIFIDDVNMQGVHLRFGPASRGGIRWSDRQADFRKEVLELVKTQQSKNVVIVPAGSKGGFVIKKPPKDKNEFMKEGVKQYKRFISGLLDITDSLDQQGQIIHPKSVLTYDENDPYLVVAADKGTAAFSDYANKLSKDRHFWMGDGFASGGSQGYNHKDIGITAKGAWECVKLHFKEMGQDCQKEAFRVIGIGDMSGDVFGNGMLLSEQIQLIAAFNHQHIFLDPNPAIKKSFQERQRLFNLEKTTWEDYDQELISKGGGVFNRKSKEIPISKEVQSLLGIKDDCLNGEELICCILKAKTDLLWFGGIGTYIKAKEEVNLRVGDPANDFIRINVEDCQARVIGEGANLGITPLARIYLSHKRVRINTDYIDNSAGVNMSDYEVNLKILFKKLMDEKQIKSMEERNSYLKKIENDVTELVLRNNRDNHRLLSIDQLRSKIQAESYIEFLQKLVKEGMLDPKSEVIPKQKFLDDISHSKQAFPRPLLALLQAYVKMQVSKSLQESPLLEKEELQSMYRSYFPKDVQKRFQTHLEGHYLQKEIIATSMCNKIINQAGALFYEELHHSTAKQIDEISISYLIVDKALEGDKLRSQILESTAEIQVQYETLIFYEEMLVHLLRDQLTNKTEILENIKEFNKSIQYIQKEVSFSKEKCLQWQKKGFSEELSKKLSVIAILIQYRDTLIINQNTPLNTSEALIAVQGIESLFNLQWLKEKILLLESHSRWEAEQKEGLYQALLSSQMNMINQILEKDAQCFKKTKDLTEIIKQISRMLDVRKKERFFKHMTEVKRVKHPPRIMLSVLIQDLQQLS